MRPVNVVLVDDDEVARLCFSRLLKGLPCCLESFACPLECFKVLTSNQPSLLFVDMQMPRMNGIELLEKIQAHWDINQCEMYLCSAAEPTSEILSRTNAIGVSATTKDVIMSKHWLGNCITECCQ